MAIDIAARVGTGGARRKRRAVRLSARDRITIAVMVGVPVLVVGGLVWFPTVASILLSFTNWDGIGGVSQAHWIGTQNYRQIATINPEFWPAVKSYAVRLRNLAAMRRIVRRKDLPAEPFVFCPLHYQPEATLLGASPAWLDQLALVRLLSASLPAGHRLVVKDHPVIGGTRAPAFYRSVRQLPNVVLLDERVSGRWIARARNCSLVATIGGTVGLEAMLFGKPVLVFGRVYYDCMDTVLKPPSDLNDLPQFLKRILILQQHPRADEITGDVRTFLAAWISIMRPAGKATYWAQEDEVGAGRDWARLVHEMSEQLRTAELVSRP